VWVSLRPYAASNELAFFAKPFHCLARPSVKVMPKLVTGFMRRLDRSKDAMSGNCITATFIGAMLYHQVALYLSMACGTACASKRCSSTEVAPVSTGMLTPISMPAM